MTFSRLIVVELRKMLDTRAGFWLQLIVWLLTPAAVALYAIFGETSGLHYDEFLGLALAPSQLLLPIVGILLVSSEWSQRTAMVTFTLVPRRERVLGAKLAAGLVLGLAAFVICVVVAALGNLSVGGEWTLSAAVFGQMIISVATGMAIGVGFGALFLASAPAIVCSFLLPTAFAAVGSLAPFRGAATWLDQTRALGPLTEHSLSASEWAHAGAALALWMVVPLAVGLARIMRSDVA
jgi:ABC-type transport system involved in multi-copper enzyme maturation permease subunit